MLFDTFSAHSLQLANRMVMAPLTRSPGGLIYAHQDQDAGQSPYIDAMLLPSA